MQRLYMSNNRPYRRWIFAVALIIIIWTSIICLSRVYDKFPQIPAYGLELGDLERIDRDLALSPSFAYRRYCFLVEPKSTIKRSSHQHVYNNLLSGSDDDTIYQRALSDESELPECTKSMHINTPDPNQWWDLDTSKLLLGIATTLSRVQSSLPAFSRWLSNTNTRLVILVTDQTDLKAVASEVESVRLRAETLNMKIEMRPYHSPKDSEALKNFALSDILRSECKPDTEWIGIADDDTFFISLPKLVHELSTYDSSLHWYIGGLTESMTQMARIGWLALGGAGIFLSRPLLEDVADHGKSCRALRQPGRGGDTLWRDCITRATYTKLTTWAGLRQIDLWKDVSGFYESGLQELLTVHHWKSWHYAPIPMASLVSDVAGPDTFLQRYQFKDNVVLTNGYSIAEYPRGVPDLESVELTMMKKPGSLKKPKPMEYAHSLGPQRPALIEGSEKKSWRFEYAVKDRHGTVRQIYIRRGIDGSPDDVIELDWIEGGRDRSFR